MRSSLSLAVLANLEAAITKLCLQNCQSINMCHEEQQSGTWRTMFTAGIVKQFKLTDAKIYIRD